MDYLNEDHLKAAGAAGVERHPLRPFLPENGVR